MLTLRSLALLSVAGGLVQALDIGTLDPCAHNCLLSAPTFDCPASQYACLCPKADWGFAVRDCALQACPADYEPALMAALTAGCSAVGAPFPAGETAGTPPAETPTPEPTTEVPPGAEPTPTESPTAKLDEEVTSTAVESSPTAESTTKAASTPTGSPSKSSSAGESEETNKAPEDEGAPAGLPEAAKIGIGVGVGAAVVALIGVGVCIFLRNRQADKKSHDSSSEADRYKISPPMPSREQNPYNHGNNSSDYDIGGANELEIKSYRYDDMTEGKQPKPMEPRQMV